MKLIYKILVPIFIILVVTFFTIDIVASNIFQDMFFEEKALDLISHTNDQKTKMLTNEDLAKDPHEASTATKIKEFAKSVNDPSIFRIKIWDKSLGVVYSDLGEIIGTSHEIGIATIRNVFLGKTPAGWVIVKNADSDSTEKGYGSYLDITVPITNLNNEVIYVVEVFSTTAAITTALASRMQNIAFILGGLGAFFAISMYLIIYLIITRPIRKLSEAMDIIGAGHLSYELVSKSRDEIGSLYKNFDNMRLQLKNYLEEVAQSKQGLEKAQSELERTNQNLEEKLAELEKFKKLTIDRELKMIELKEEILKCRSEGNKK